MQPTHDEHPDVTYLDYDDYDQETACCLDGDVCHLYLNWQAAAGLQLALFGFWTEYEYNEDTDIFDDHASDLAPDCAERVHDCTIMLISEERAQEREQAGIGRVKYWMRIPEHAGRDYSSRVQFYLTRSDMKAAFLAVRTLMADRDTPGQSEIFPNLVVHFVPSKEPIRNYFEGKEYRLKGQ